MTTATSNSSSSSNSKLSLMELKRQQWAQEREEAKSEWCPWGRPGCGAPLKPSTRSEPSRLLTPVDPAKNNSSYLPPLNNWSNYQQQTPSSTPLPPSIPPPPLSQRRSARRFISMTPGQPATTTAAASQQTDGGETSGYHSDTNHHHHHLIDPRSSYHHQQGPSPQPPPPPPPTFPTSSSDPGDVISARADYKFLERRKWVQEGHVPYDHQQQHHVYGHHSPSTSTTADHLPQIYENLQQQQSQPPRWVVVRPQTHHVSAAAVASGGGGLPIGTSDQHFLLHHHQHNNNMTTTVSPAAGSAGDSNIGTGGGGGAARSYYGGGGYPVPPYTATAAPTFLRGQNVVVEPSVLLEREAKRAKATELQRILLQQLAEKEAQKAAERRKQQEDERRQEEELCRQLETEKRQIEEEQRRIREKKEAEERRLEAVKEAIAGAQQNALAEKMARRTNKCLLIPPAADYQVAQVDIITSSPTAAAATSDARQEHQNQPTAEPITAAPTQQQQVMRSRRESPSPSVVDAQVQTEQQLKVPNCSNCENNKHIIHNKGGSKSQFIRISPRVEGGGGGVGDDSERPGTQMSLIALKSQSSNSTMRPLWGAHQSKAKYQSQTEKDPRFLYRRRERLRRRQKLLLEKQLHGSWPSSENSGTSREDMGGDIFFPFLPVGSQHHHQHHHGPTERYYEALQAAAIGTSYYKRKKTPIPILPPPPPSSNQNNNSHHHLNNKKQQQYQAVSDVLIQQSSSNGAGVGGKVPVEPGKIPQTPMMTTTMANGSVPYRHNSSNELSHQSTITRLMSPPVPALLKKLKIANGEALTDAEVVGVNGGEWQDYDDSGTFKISKELENLHIKTDTSRHTTTIVSEQDKKDLLFRLSLLKQGLEKKKTALDAMSQVSSQ